MVEMKPLLFVLTAAVLAGACRSTTPATSAPPSSPDVWAVVNGAEVRRDAIEKTYRRGAQLTPPPSDDEAMTAKLALLNEFIVQELLLAKARDLNVAVTDEELDAAYNEGRRDIPEEDFQQELKNRNLTAADMRDGLRRDMTVEKLLEQEVSSKITVAEQDVTEFFNANREQFNRPEDAYHIAQIVVTPTRDPQVANRTGNDAATPQEATAKAQMLMERLKAGDAFDELAASFSEDPQTAPRGGNLGFVPVSALRQAPSALRDAVLKATPGTVTMVSQGGAHTIVLLIAKEPAGQRDLTSPEVREGITNTLRGRREQLLRAAYLSALRNDAVVVNHLANQLVSAQGTLPGLGLARPQ